ncbi:MAG: S-layer protein [Candidatus Aenigmatarchaeota archaeon]
MQLKRAIAAGALGALMAGSTLAFAASLADFPAPFVEDGASNFLVVVGEAAATSDVVGAIDLAARLGGEPVISETKTVAAAGVGETVTGEGKQVKAPGEDFNYGEDINDVMATAFDKTDLPTVLADGTFEESEGDTDNEVDYTQTLDFTDNTAQLVFDVDDNDADKPAGTYLLVDEAVSPLFTYALEFVDDVKYTTVEADCPADFEDTTLDILGKSYTITDATCVADNLESLELMGGALETTLEHGATGTYTVSGKTYTISVRVYSATKKVIFDVSGATSGSLELSEGQTKKLPDGTELGLRSILASNKEGIPDSARFFVGAQKLELEDGSAVKIGGAEIEGWDTTVTFTTGAGTLSKIEIEATPEDSSWVGVGESLADPIFNAWSVKLNSISKTTEKISATASAEDGELSLTDVAGNELEIPVIDGGDADDDGVNDVQLGDDLMDDAVITVSGVASDNGEGGNLLIMDGDSCDSDDSLADCEGIRMLVSSEGGEARIVEITDIDTANNEVDLKDLTTGAKWENKDYTDATDTDIQLGGFTTITLNINEATYTVTAKDIVDYDFDGDGNTTEAAVKTSLSGAVVLDYVAVAGDGTVNVLVYNDDAADDVAEFDFVDDDGDVSIDDIDNPATMYAIEKDSDTKVGLDDANWGAITTWDSDAKDDLTVEYPEEAVVANVWLLKPGATVVSGGAGQVTYTTQTVAPIKTMVGKLDTELSAADKAAKNVISVGGPCVNRVTAELLGKAYPACGEASGITPGTALIKLVENAFGGNKVALVVAGWEAEDTREATSALQNFETAGLTGTEKVM